jgi:hypothetical protein
VRGNCKRQAHVHPAGVALDWRVQEFLNLRKCYNPSTSLRTSLVKLAVNLGSPHAEDGAIHVDVLAPCQLWMEAGADFQQRANTAVNNRAPFRRLGDARDPSSILQSPISNCVPQRVVAFLRFADVVEFGEIFDAEGEVSHGSSRNRMVA